MQKELEASADKGERKVEYINLQDYIGAEIPEWPQILVDQDLDRGYLMRTRLRDRTYEIYVREGDVDQMPLSLVTGALMPEYLAEGIFNPLMSEYDESGYHVHVMETLSELYRQPVTISREYAKSVESLVKLTETVLTELPDITEEISFPENIAERRQIGWHSHLEAIKRHQAYYGPEGKLATEDPEGEKDYSDHARWQSILAAARVTGTHAVDMAFYEEKLTEISEDEPFDRLLATILAKHLRKTLDPMIVNATKEAQQAGRLKDYRVGLHSDEYRNFRDTLFRQLRNYFEQFEGRISAEQVDTAIQEFCVSLTPEDFRKDILDGAVSRAQWAKKDRNHKIFEFKDILTYQRHILAIHDIVFPPQKLSGRLIKSAQRGLLGLRDA